MDRLWAAPATGLYGRDIPFNFEERLQHFFYHVAVLPSMDCGLISRDHLTVSGDGTALHTHACPRGRHGDGAPENLRHFSDPDATWGWDSGLDKYYFGYTLFQLSCYNRELRTDIPLFLHFTSAKRHDSVSFLVAFHELEKHMPALPSKTCAWILLWTITLPIGSSRKGGFGHSST